MDGGVSRNDFVCQLLADLSGLPVERCTNTEMSAMGAAYLAGQAAGVWADQSEVAGLRVVERVFEPRTEHAAAAAAGLALWTRAVGRFLDWYPADDTPAPAPARTPSTSMPSQSQSAPSSGFSSAQASAPTSTPSSPSPHEAEKGKRELGAGEGVTAKA